MKIYIPEENNYIKTVDGQLVYMKYGELPPWDMSASTTSNWAYVIPIGSTVLGAQYTIYTDAGTLQGVLPTFDPITCAPNCVCRGNANRSFYLETPAGSYYQTSGLFTSVLVPRGYYCVWYIP